MSKIIAGTGVIVVLLALGAAGAMPEEKVVQITDKGFVPDKLEVTLGQRVVWENATLKDHTVTARSKAPGKAGVEQEDKPLFDSGAIKPGATWEHTFTKEGTFEYL
ncbi:MAG TPA: plastocyanin/azurin family copper-binding protein, partial [Planctomycetota bacterium]|nr:plastocyanin/azurin family copper-binding protein [Planctomycetota bacterium]